MRWSEQVAHVVVVGGMLVGVSHDETNRASSRLSLERAAQNFHSVGFVPACCHAALSGPAPVELALDEVDVDVDAGRQTVYHSSHGFSMALPESRKCEYVAESVTHVSGDLFPNGHQDVIPKQCDILQLLVVLLMTVWGILSNPSD